MVYYSFIHRLLDELQITDSGLWVGVKHPYWVKEWETSEGYEHDYFSEY